MIQLVYKVSALSLFKVNFSCFPTKASYLIKGPEELGPEGSASMGGMRDEASSFMKRYLLFRISPITLGGTCFVSHTAEQPQARARHSKIHRIFL